MAQASAAGSGAGSGGTSLRVRIQRFGSYLSGMVMPNIGAFIAWGLITALFIPDGWLPNERLAALVDPMILYLLPLLIGYTGGRLVYDVRGGVVGAVATIGVIVGSDIPMFLGALIMGPLGGYLIMRFDRLFEGRIRQGFEMLVNNFSAGILGAILGVLGAGPVITALSDALGAGVNFIVNLGLLPLVSIFVEPAKILFLNMRSTTASSPRSPSSSPGGREVHPVPRGDEPRTGAGHFAGLQHIRARSHQVLRAWGGDHPLPGRHTRDLLPLRTDEAAAAPRGHRRRG